jgi:hypothetical protein
MIKVMKNSIERELNEVFLIESIASIDKSSIQVYEETCKRLNICPCSMIIRSLYTNSINLKNYGLGTKGSAALAVALIVKNSYDINHWIGFSF